jgi:hypothetical protein
LVYPDLAVCELDVAWLCTVVTDLAAGLSRRAWSRHLLGAQPQDHFQGLHPDLMDDRFHNRLAGRPTAAELALWRSGDDSLPIAVDSFSAMGVSHSSSSTSL